MLTHISRWSHAPGNAVVPSPWQATICESCTFFVTTIEFRPTLERQRKDAEAKGQKKRQEIFDGLLTRLDESAC